MTAAVPSSPLPSLTRDTIDQALAELGERYERIATAMYALDTHTGHAFLRTARLSGASLAVRDEVQGRGAVLWAQFAALGEAREQAGQVRARRGRPGDSELSDLTRLLRDPVIGLDSDGVPVTASATAPAVYVRLAELASGIESVCRELTGKVDQVATAVTVVIDRATPMGESLTAADSLADALGMGPERALAPLADELSTLREKLLDDPLSAVSDPATDAALRRLATDIDAARERFTRLDQLRRSAPQRLAGARATLAELSTAESTAAEAYHAAHAIICAPGLPAPPAAAASRRDDLAAATRLADAGDWARFADCLLAWDQASEQAIVRARELREAADGLVTRRTELRGRLQAYQSKATRLGVVEEAAIADCYAAARDLLWSSPCDLRAATRAVRDYQDAIAAVEERR